MKSLLETARAAPATKRPIDPGELDLAIALFHGSVTDTQAATALGCSKSHAIFHLSRVVRWALKAGTLKPLEKRNADESK